MNTNNDNRVAVSDFNTLKGIFGRAGAHLTT